MRDSRIKFETSDISINQASVIERKETENTIEEHSHHEIHSIIEQEKHRTEATEASFGEHSETLKVRDILMMRTEQNKTQGDLKSSPTKSAFSKDSERKDEKLYQNNELSFPGLSVFFMSSCN